MEGERGQVGRGVGFGVAAEVLWSVQPASIQQSVGRRSLAPKTQDGHLQLQQQLIPYSVTSPGYFIQSYFPRYPHAPTKHTHTHCQHSLTHPHPETLWHAHTSTGTAHPAALAATA